VTARQQLQFSGLISQISQGELQVINARNKGRDLSFILLQPAEELRMFAQEANNNQMAALAFIERAEVLRTELYYRSGQTSKEDFQMQISEAKASYNEAIRLAPNKTLVSTAKLGLGLCEEELGDFDTARQIYRDIVENPDFEGATAKAAAAHRLEIMTDYKDDIVFTKAPIALGAGPDQTTFQQDKPTTTSEPSIAIGPGEVNQLSEVNLPVVNQ
jgi:tetratricopeptide (TPR) repeat protein